MDGSGIEHSDSDSGESWTLLENTSTASQANDPPKFSETPKCEGGVTDNTDKDEDTDGISIISDSDPELSTPSENSYDRCVLEEESRPTEQHIPQYVLINPLPSNNNDDKKHHESIRSEENFLGDNSGKVKTYVHRRNKRLSTVLNIVMLGSVITAAGVAIGHMWGVRDDCSIQSTASVNKILSNLYKLQEENAYLRSKLKELTIANNIQMQMRKFDSEKLPVKQQRCKKIFEESLSNKNTNKIIKCVENIDQTVESHMIPEHEKDFLNDIDKLKRIYEQNRSWLDEEVVKRIKNERSLRKNMKDLKQSKIKSEQGTIKNENLKKQLTSSNELSHDEDSAGTLSQTLVGPVLNNVEDSNKEMPSEKTLTYADSLKSDKTSKKKDEKIITESKIAENTHKKRFKKSYDIISDSMSEQELKKDDRYSGHKQKLNKKKNDRQKSQKKQKRKNKYEQWEMKGGYMKDYDSTVTLSQENEYDKLKLNIDQSTQIDDSIELSKEFEPSSKAYSKYDKGDKELSWYDKRAALRTEARKKLEQQLFGENSLNNAGWYFRRMQKREQCRAKGDNSTYRKFSKQNKNYKIKK